MAQKRYNNNKKAQKPAGNSTVGLVCVLISAFLFLCLVFPIFLGPISLAIKNVLLGIFGYFIFPLIICIGTFGVFSLQNRKLSVPSKYVLGIVGITFIFMLILQLATSTNYMGEDFNYYISNTFSEKTAGGVFFGIFVYPIHSIIKTVASIVVYCLAMLIVIFFMLKSKFTEQKIQPQKPTRAPFVKGAAYPAPVKPLPDTSLFVDVIQPSRLTEVEYGTFDDMDEEYESEYYKGVAREQEYLNAKKLSPVEESIKFESYHKNEEELEEIDSKKYKSKAHEILFGDIDNYKPLSGNETSYSSASKQKLNSKYEPSLAPLSNPYLPPLTSTQPDIRKDDTRLNSKKPPKIVYNDSKQEVKDMSSFTNKLQPLAMPPEKDVSDIYVGGHIVNGDEESQKLAGVKDEPKKQITSSSFDELGKVYPKTPPLNSKPIVNGDNFANPPKAEKSINLAPQPIFQKQINPNPTPIVKASEVKAQSDNRPPYSVVENDSNLNSSSPIINSNIYDKLNSNQYEPKQDNKKSFDYDDNDVVDLSENDADFSDDYSGYYEPTIEKITKMPYDKPKAGRVENQIKLDDYLSKSVTEEKNKQKPKRRKTRYNPPPIELLSATLSTTNENFSADCEEKARQLEQTLKELKLPATVSGITRGPAVTRYELDMPPGIPIKKIEQFSTDIEYYLASNGKIRIETPIPGKRAVGIEVPNESIDVVGLRDIIESKDFKNSTSPLPMALGKDIAGDNILCGLEKMPHLLIAGATGSGKSACLNSLIISLLYKCSPDEVRLILIDPKYVEFEIYKGLPHLMTGEIITDATMAYNVFKWLREEMERRYLTFRKYLIRNLAEFNKSDAVKNGEEEKLPYIILIVDELAEFMMSNNKRELEDKIMSMAQKARAAGIHLILATQRPSVDVITGTIKANLPSRVAFSVRSVIDSRTILDQAGAETLLGRGDMLYAPFGVDEPKRVQGAYVTTEEVYSVVEYIKENNCAEFDEEFIESISATEEANTESSSGEDSEFDPLVPQVLKLFIETGQASTSFVQRRFAVGYARASRIIDQLELKNFIGPLENGKPRTVFITRDQYFDLFGEEI